jgi:hypothetical protein
MAQAVSSMIRFCCFTLTSPADRHAQNKKGFISSQFYYTNIEIEIYRKKLAKSLAQSAWPK